MLAYGLRVEPAEHFLHWQQDPFGNFQARVVVPEPARAFEVSVELRAELHVLNPFDFFLEPDAEHWPFHYEKPLAQDLTPYFEKEALGPRLAHFLDGLPRERMRTIDFLVDLNQRLQRAVEYVIRMEPGVQDPEHTLEVARGSCRDSAWLLVQALRHLGFAARFTSGYLIQLVADERPIEGPAGTDRDFTDLHAWTEVFLPGGGWVGLDPTSGLFAGEGHIPLACTPHPTSASPIQGSVDDCEVEFGHEMWVERVDERARITKPYSEAQWQEILSLGDAVEERLQAADVRLTQGGEPTFVGIDSPDAPEWNITSDGAEKRARGEELLRRLHARLDPGGLLHFGQGKWYPGEPLPRWAYGLYWRPDGDPLWEDAGLLADASASPGFGESDAQRFVQALAKRLEVDPGFALPAYEDAWYYLWRERRLPSNVDPHDARLDDPLERTRLARVFGQGLAQIVGYALPLRPREGAPTGQLSGWRSGRWFLRDERLYLVPGDSPMGYRLPLDSLPWASETQRESERELPVDPFARRGALLRRADLRRQPGAPGDEDELRAPEPAGVARTALCVEPRGGVLHVFLPPLERLEDFVALAHALEETAAALGTPVRLEGYPPPGDPRIAKLEVTPDPGVIEVNVAPSVSWRELVRSGETLYEEARAARLRAEKFMLDGRHTGTGGGNHITLGGPTPADSPFLRRPDLLRSLIGYWQDHPSLSYLFSGLFIGPTSQAPRIDEARHDALHEVEIAFEQLGASDAPAPPWRVDRALRHLLVDSTGNTHRTEVCIDKLYSPDGPRGRLGLVELRAFEMPPHARMAALQQLLVRALVARFWEQPYAPHLPRYGTQLHDRFMLPHFVEQDFGDVLAELRTAGIAFDPAWFTPFADFRFPVLGQVVRAGVEIQLRLALEPWHVLGEETASAGTARYVDSSLERVQVRVRGGLGDRYAVTCNGRSLPLHPTGTQGEAVAGVRYRAWHPPSGLHPTIGVHAPLVFDVVDTWMERSLGGCTYHVSHPGGLSHERFPVNANEAETRRGARFSELAMTPGRLRAPPVRTDPEFPFTLDLRRI